MITVNIILFIGIFLIISVFFVQDKSNFKLSTVLLILVSLLISFIVGQRSIEENFMVQNDTSVYNDYINCLRDYEDNECRNKVIQLPPNELLFTYVSKVGIWIGFNNAMIFFAITFILLSCYINFIKPLGNLMLPTFGLILTTPIFWELSSNILRNSLSISFFFLLLTVLFKDNQGSYKKIALYFGGLLSHTSFFIYSPIFLLYKQVSVKLLFILFIFGLLFSSSFTVIILTLSNYLSNDLVILNKIIYYINNSSGIGFKNYMYVIGNMNILIIFYLYFASLSIKDNWYLSTLKVLLLLLILGSFAGNTNFVYRIINVYELLLIPLLLFTIKKRTLYSGYVILIYALYKLYMFDYFYPNYTRFFNF